MAVYSPSSCARVLYVLGLHGGSLTTGENGARLFAITSTDGSAQNSVVAIIQLAKVPLGIGTLNPSTGPAVGGSIITLHGSGFVSGTQVTIGGKPAVTTFKDAHTPAVVTASVSTGAQQL